MEQSKFTSFTLKELTSHLVTSSGMPEEQAIVLAKLIFAFTKIKAPVEERTPDIGKHVRMIPDYKGINELFLHCDDLNKRFLNTINKMNNSLSRIENMK